MDRPPASPRLLEGREMEAPLLLDDPRLGAVKLRLLFEFWLGAV